MDHSSNSNQKSVSDLQWELDKLRDSTKSAMQISWEEVERLQKESSVYAERSEKLKRQLAELQSEMKERGLSEFIPTSFPPNGCPNSEDFPLSEINSMKSAQNSKKRLGLRFGHAFGARDECVSLGSLGGNNNQTRSLVSEPSVSSLPEKMLPGHGDVASDTPSPSVWGKIRSMRTANPAAKELMDQLAQLDHEKKETICRLEAQLGEKKSLIKSLERKVDLQNQTLAELRKDLKISKAKSTKDRMENDMEIARARDEVNSLAENVHCKDSQLREITLSMGKKRALLEDDSMLREKKNGFSGKL
mmetsp:Transcript_2596/g.3988  ORF Transcript_2596/g.3988 Transcript_2596/m.3988 type:complete len:304 (+) Transcript_2596:268-1179(+)|eukprot:CAMPEP_0195529486 /NCGR_PEP_ID=MMETSP0794_2-20130614/32036_1 /TAXON_ID=515487 /ORGANISM="Stephanopyxis turris, Strain CCMP 815" /LENGTH=303 /DNA_ID=CAMNT_0040660797 /DNA_START=198 /DNA_END=1109 /DNA_ORIENTATION=+